MQMFYILITNINKATFPGNKRVDMRRFNALSSATVDLYLAAMDANVSSAST